MKNFNLCVIGNISDRRFPGAEAFYNHVRHWKTHYPLILYADNDCWPDVIKLKGSFDIAKSARYPNGQPNTWAPNNLCFLTAINIARSKGFTHMLYLESDCRMMGNNWDEIVVDEYLDAANDRTLFGGSVVVYNPCNRNLTFSRAWHRFLAKNQYSPFPIPAFGGNGAAEKHEPAVLVNGALGIFDMDFLASIFDLTNTVKTAGEVTAWDYHIGRELVRKHGDETFKHVEHLSTIFSSYGNVTTTEAERRELLLKGEVVAVHQIKSPWTPEENLAVGGVAEKADADVAKIGRSESRSSAPGMPSNPISYQSCVDQDEGSNPSTTRTPKVSLFIVSHAKDAEWLKYCLLSIGKFARGFLRTIVVVPRAEETSFEWLKSHAAIAGNESFYKLRVVFFDQAEAPKGHIHHCAIKCMADTFDDEAECFAYIDSDCIFKEPVTPADYFVDGKPVLLFEAYASLTKKKDGAVCWQKGVSEVMGWQSRNEYMRRHPAVHHRDLLVALRKHIEDVHKTRFLSFVLSRKPDYPTGFCEFNSMGDFAHYLRANDYHWINLEEEARPKDKLIQFWSHRAPELAQDVWLDGTLMKGVIPIEVIHNLLVK
jgi:hypothetical protein